LTQPPLDTSITFDVAIIGAGISGLVAGSILLKHGANVLILEKSKGVGGRLASRRIATPTGKEAYFDLGAQFLEFSDSRIQIILKGILQDDLLENWRIQSHSNLDLIRPLPSMNAFPKKFASVNRVVKEKRVIQIAYQAPLETWLLHLNTGESVSAKKVISTIPIPQFLELIDNSELTPEASTLLKLKSVHYAPSIAVMAVLKNSASPILLRDPDPSISWIIDNQFKGISVESPSLTIIASPSWAECHLQDMDADIYKQLWEKAGFRESLEAISYQIHRWRYAIPQYGVETLFLKLKFEKLSKSSTFLIAGDSFGESHLSAIEKAIMSGHKVAELIVTTPTA
jgi:predicted NAD/FAD-dependent oxidoreductase